METKLSYPEKVGVRIRYYSELIGIPQCEIASRLSEVTGASELDTHKWVKGESAPNNSNAEQIAELFGITTAALLSGGCSTPVSKSQPPIELQAIAELYKAGELTNDDLSEIDRFARLLANKNRKHS